MIMTMTPNPRKKLAVISALALLAFSLAAGGLYVWKKYPHWIVSPEQRAAIELAAEEAEINTLLKQNPEDPVAMIRLAAVQVYRGVNDAQTLALLDRAEAQLPGDRRIAFIRHMIKYPNIELPQN